MKAIEYAFSRLRALRSQLLALALGQFCEYSLWVVLSLLDKDESASLLAAFEHVFIDIQHDDSASPLGRTHRIARKFVGLLSQMSPRLKSLTIVIPEAASGDKSLSLPRIFRHFKHLQHAQLSSKIFRLPLRTQLALQRSMIGFDDTASIVSRSEAIHDRAVVAGSAASGLSSPHHPYRHPLRSLSLHRPPISSATVQSARDSRSLSMLCSITSLSATGVGRLIVGPVLRACAETVQRVALRDVTTTSGVQVDQAEEDLSFPQLR